MLAFTASGKQHCKHDTKFPVDGFIPIWRNQNISNSTHRYYLYRNFLHILKLRFKYMLSSIRGIFYFNLICFCNWNALYIYIYFSPLFQMIKISSDSWILCQNDIIYRCIKTIQPRKQWENSSSVFGEQQRLISHSKQEHKPWYLELHLTTHSSFSHEEHLILAKAAAGDGGDEGRERETDGGRDVFPWRRTLKPQAWAALKTSAHKRHKVNIQRVRLDIWQIDVHTYVTLPHMPIITHTCT